MARARRPRGLHIAPRKGPWQERNLAALHRIKELLDEGYFDSRRDRLAEASQRFGVGPTSILQLLRVARERPDLLERVRKRELSAWQAWLETTGAWQEKKSGRSWPRPDAAKTTPTLAALDWLLIGGYEMTMTERKKKLAAECGVKTGVIEAVLRIWRVAPHRVADIEAGTASVFQVIDDLTYGQRVVCPACGGIGYIHAGAR